MSKYDALWAHIQNCGQPQLTLTFDEIGRIAGTPLDHSFDNEASIVLGVMFLPGSLLCRYGAELTQQDA